MTRRELLAALGSAAAGSLVATRIVEATFGDGGALAAQALPLTSTAGLDRVVMLKGKTYLNAWVGFGPRPRRGGGAGTGAPFTAIPNYVRFNRNPPAPPRPPVPPPDPSGAATPRPAPPPPTSVVWMRGE